MIIWQENKTVPNGNRILQHSRGVHWRTRMRAHAHTHTHTHFAIMKATQKYNSLPF